MPRWTDEQLAEFQKAHGRSTARPIPDGRMLVAGKADTSWDTIHPQYLELRSRMRLVQEEPTTGSPRPEWAVLEKT